MPIRMVDDPNDRFDNSNDDRGRGGGGGGGLFNLIPLLLSLGMRNPKIFLVLIVIGGLFYFLGGKQGCNMANSPFSTGGVLDPQEFQKAPVYEGLDPSKTDLPEYISLLKFAPDRKNQGQQGSCVAWSSAYGARSILEATSTGNNPNSTAFSPSFLYNQIGLDGCNGSYIIRAMENMTKVGSVPFSDFPYDETDCSRQPGQQLKQEASQFKMLGFTRLTNGDRIDNLDLHAIKEHLAKDVPVVIGMMVGGSFMQGMMGKEVWHPTESDYNQYGFGGHAMCVIGYDDRKDGGAFQIMNSWGPEWGVNGIGWVRYNDFKYFVKEAYGLNRMPKTGSAASTDLDCTIGLVENKSKKYIPLQLTQGNLFSTTTAVEKGIQFKMEVKNNIECYIYVLGKETDGSSYVLFPYPSKQDPKKTMFSPYCGITGYRLFPRGMSMMADSIGTRDMMAVIVSKDSLNVFTLNDAVNSRRGSGFEQAINTALRSESIQGVNFSSTGNGTISFKTNIGGSRNAVACIVAIDKR